MAPESRRGGASVPDRRRHSNKAGGGGALSIISRISQSPAVSGSQRAACSTAFVTKKFLQSTGKAAWIAGTTALVLFLPLVIEIDRDQLLNNLELHQASLLGTPPP